MNTIIHTALAPQNMSGYCFHPEGEIVVDVQVRSRITDIVWLHEGPGVGVAKIVREPQGGIGFVLEPPSIRQAYRLQTGDTFEIIGDQELWQAWNGNLQAMDKIYSGISFDRVIQQ